MAPPQNPKKPAEPDINDAVRAKLAALFRLLWIVLPIVALIYVGYKFYGAAPRRQLGTAEQTITAYTQFVGLYTADTGRPSENAVSDFLDFFDKKSRDYFWDNYDTMARLRTQFEPDHYWALSKGEKSVEGMLFVISHPPLNGIASIKEQRSTSADKTELLVQSATAGQRPITMEKSGDLWYIADFGGAREAMEKELSTIRNQPLPPKPTPTPTPRSDAP
ncbi:hypothetical protein BH09SUM1_BH09SUM1_06840 [soil metagenome]